MRKREDMKTKLAGGILLLGVALALLGLPQPGWSATACISARFNDWRDLGRCQMPTSPQTASSAGCAGCGMPAWWVTEPYVTLWLSDEPLSYYTSSGQRMSFRWTYQQRGQLAGDLRLREVDGASQVPLKIRAGTAGGAFTMTNAAWSHNLWSEIVFWDTHFETNTFPWEYYPPAAPASRCWPLAASYEALVLLGDGGTLYFNGASETTPNGTGKARLEVIGRSPAGGPETPFYFGYGEPYPYPTSGTTWVETPQFGFRLIYPDGSQDIYGFVRPVYGYFDIHPCPYGAGDPRCQTTQDYTARAYLTQRIDPQGRITRLGYQKLQSTGQDKAYFNVCYVVDADGRTNTYYYNPNNHAQLQCIVDAYGRTNALSYNDGQGTLASITDAAGLTNSLQYQPAITVTTTNGMVITTTTSYSGWLTNLATPYGNTRFDYAETREGDATNGEYISRAIMVTEPNAAHQLYYYLHNASPNVAASGQVPMAPGYGFDPGNVGASHPGLNYRNTFHWDRRQFTALSSNVLFWLQPPLPPPLGQPPNLGAGLASLIAEDYRKARLQHWLLDTDLFSITDSLSSERDPSPDAAGQIEGARTWYDYAGKDPANPQVTGTEPLVGCLARVLPDGTSQYETRDYDRNGNLLTQRESYTTAGGTVGERTNSLAYSTNGVDLFSVSNSLGQWVKLAYNTNHQVTFLTNALNQVTLLGYDSATRHLTSLSLVGGLTASLAYYPSNAASANGGLLSSITWSPLGRSLTFTYTNSLPRTVTDDRGLSLTNTWDGLNRLTSTVFPDGTYISNIYDKLDLTAARDRLGRWTYFGHDPLQHLTAVTNANNAVTRLNWCDCGALSSLVDALNNTTSLYYNNQGQLTNVVFADGSSVTNTFDLAGRLTGAADGQNRGLSYGYNNQGLVTVVSNAYGPVERVVYDASDRPVQVTDADNVTVTDQFDLLNRLTARFWPDSGVAGLLWSTNGLAAYTNQNHQVTRFRRDAAGRLTAVTNANLEVTRLGYNSLGEVTDLWDGLNHNTHWNYDVYGRLTNKVDALGREMRRLAYDANGRATNRWTPQFGNTPYAYDAVGNLTNVFYVGQASSLSYSYNLLNQLTTMIDAVGTHHFDYTPAGQLATEDGPWADDLVAYDYKQGLRSSMGVAQPGGVDWYQMYAYDNAWRLTNLFSGAGSFGYGYGAPNSASASVARISLPNFASITNNFDALGRLQSTALVNRWGHVLDGYAYSYDPLGQRTGVTRNLGGTSSTLSLTYDAISQLTGWTATESNGIPRLNEQQAWAYDAAGNLHFRTNGGLAQTFTVDAANELTGVSRTGLLTVSGATPVPATNVTVNGQLAQTYGDFTFASPNNTLLNGTNTFASIAQNVYGVSATNNLTVNLPATVSLQYDANGNLTNDGLRSFRYDAENQLTNVTIAGVSKSEFVYDGLGRRRITREYNWQSGIWNLQSEIRDICDGMQVIQERDSNNVPLVTYTRGLDLSGSRQGAGGIGGLLARTDGNGSIFYHADGLGNVTALMDQHDNVPGRYMYNPFGKLVGKWGPFADVNEMGFSSMPWHDGLIGYLGRFYDPNFQRWITLDPAGERGGINRYRAMNNNPLRFIDPDGRAPQMTGATFDPNTGTSTAQYTDQQFGQGYGIGLHSPSFNPLSAMANDLDAAWNYGLDQITPPINPNTDPYSYAATQTARDVALAALLAAATDRIGKPGGKVPCPKKAPFYHYSNNPNLAGGGLKAGSGVTSVGDLTAKDAMFKLGIDPPKYVYPVNLYNPLDSLVQDLGTPGRNTIPSWKVEVPTPPGSVGPPTQVPPGN